MSWYNRLKSFFNAQSLTKEIPQQPYVPQTNSDNLVIVQENIEMSPLRLPFDTDFITQPPKSMTMTYDWLEDEDALRDEGVIFGLSDVRVEEKVGMIRSYFVSHTAALDGQIENLNEQIQELNLFINQRETDIETLKNKTTTLENRQSEGQHELLRTAVGLVCSVAMCVGNYFLIAEVLRPHFTEAGWVSMGVFLAGMFNMFGRISFFHESSGEGVPVRRLLEEVGMPLAAAVFVGVQAAQSQSVINALALFGFVFFLFLFAGKLLLSTLTVLRNDIKIWSTDRQLNNDKTNKTADWETKIETLETEMNQLRVQKWKILPDLTRLEADRNRLNARRDLLIKIFESEFNLARQLKEKLSDRDLQRLSQRLNNPT
jgi:hypothetical protein